MIHARTGTHRVIVGGIAVGLLLAGCSSSSPTSGSSEAAVGASAASGRTVTKYEVVSQLEPLTKAVVSYTDTNYGDDPASQALLDAVVANYDEIQRQEDLWRDFTASIDYASSGISGLETAVADYNDGLDEWQKNQERGITNWEKCLSQGGGDLQIATCMMAGYSLSDEQAALSAYTTPLMGLLQSLGVATQ